MKRRRLGPFDVSVVGLGCNNFGGRIDRAATRAVVDACLDHGVDFFDTADIYGDGLSETYLGEALGKRRDQVVVATKFGGNFTGEPDGKGGSAEWVVSAAEASLRRLGTDYIDLYQLHVPDPQVPIAETLGALAGLVEAGKVRAVGCSNFTVAQLDEAAVASESAGIGFASVQNQYSLLHRKPESGVLDACRRLGIGFLPYFPLHSGVLTGKYRKGRQLPEGSRLSTMASDRLGRFYDEATIDTVERLASFANSRGKSLLDLAVSWLLVDEVVVSVIAGATRPEQVAANAAAGSAWDLSTEEAAEVDAILASSG